ncbi:hypothetical protein CB1_000142012 [Camelus ferus]|nr:hypothetical protein CB1_000142012 [Camelus ferus]
MNRFDRSDRNVRQSQEGFWKRPPQRWSGQEHYHLSHPDHYHHHGKSDLSRGSPYRESPLGHFESYGGTPFFQAQKMFVDVPENTVVLDEMTLRHMVQDCTAVKTQLLKLKRLLHQDASCDCVVAYLKHKAALLTSLMMLVNRDWSTLPDFLVSHFNMMEVVHCMMFNSHCHPVRNQKMVIKYTRQLGVIATKNLKKKNAHMLINIPKHPGEEFLVGILLPPSLLGRAPSKGPHGLFRRTADRPQVLQPSSSLPRPTDPAQGKLAKPQHIEALSERTAQDAHQGVAHPDGNFTRGLQQESNNRLEGQPFSSSPQFTKDVTKSTPSAANLNMTMNTEEPYHSASHQISAMQFVPTSLQTPPQSSTVDQAKGVGRNQPSPEGYTSQPKSLQLLKPSVLNSLVPPPVPETSPSRTHTSSKLRPPSGSFKQKQTSSPRLEPPNLQAKTSIPRPLMRRKEIIH